MKWTDVAENWAAFVPRILTHWPALNEDEVIAIDGDRDAFLHYLSDREGADAATAKAELDEWLMGEQPADAIMHPTRDNERMLASGQNIPPGEEPMDDDRKFGDDDIADRPITRS